MSAFPLTCSVQNYAWGRFGEDSIIAKLKAFSEGKGADVYDDKGVRIPYANAATPYAELWMGTHISGPSRLTDGKELSTWLKENPSTVGFVPDGYPGDDLPFLFKVLSIRTALSIQSHPDKKRAAELFQLRPDIYKDPNHKPVSALAIIPFILFYVN